jgi:hypothetical protein
VEENGTLVKQHKSMMYQKLRSMCAESARRLKNKKAVLN